MHLTRQVIDTWAIGAGKRTHLIRLDEGDSMADHRPYQPVIEGPAIVELVVWRDGGWSAREAVYETPESIALAASLAQREPSRAELRALHTARDNEEYIDMGYDTYGDT